MYVHGEFLVICYNNNNMTETTITWAYSDKNCISNSSYNYGLDDDITAPGSGQVTSCVTGSSVQPQSLGTSYYLHTNLSYNFVQTLS